MSSPSLAPRIALIEDDAALSVLMKYNLHAAGYHVDHYEDGEEANLALRDNPVDLVVLDWMLPNVSGIELCRRLRIWPETQKTPIIMLTARGEESERVRGLSTGADDYIVKPFSILELMARIKALLRRLRPETVSTVLKVRDIELDKETHRANRAGRVLKLGPIEFKLLEFFMRSPNRVFTRDQLLNNVWGQDVYIDDRTVDVHIGRLRKILNRGKEKDPLRTVRGVGYAFEETSA
jgi:two-component system, OmpR family, phosphate regulon response regulator PhoB